MLKLHQLVFALLIITIPAFSQPVKLWDGEQSGAACQAAYGTVLSGIEAHSGTYCFRAQPDPSHAPRLGFNCTKFWRKDISGFDELRFFIKTNLPGNTTSVRLKTYYATGNWVNVAAYLVNSGSISNVYQEVRIPFNLFKNADFDLTSIECIELAGSAVAGLYFYIDDLVLADTKKPLISFSPLSSRVARLHTDEQIAPASASLTSNYTLSSTTDPEYILPTRPTKIGRHAFVSGLVPVSGSAIVQHELFLIFEKPLKNGKSYHLKVENLKDGAGNAGFTDTIFTFSDQNIKGNIKINQAGYLPDSPKLAKLGNFLGDAWYLPVDTINTPEFQLYSEDNNKVFEGKSIFLKTDPDFSGERVFELDFSSFSKPGKYYIYVPGYGRSEQFEIRADIYNSIYYHTARALYFQRSGGLDAKYAEEWVRNGLPQTTAEIHVSQAASPLHSNSDPAPGTPIPMQGGWLDAGDYGRYVPTAASAIFTLFTAFELFPEKFPDNYLHIPESGNNIPDILDELKYETDWLQQMQATDGGVYFRVTPATWSQGVPEEETNTLFVSEKTTQSTALFAAAMAMAARNFKKYWPAYSESCLERARQAWAFLKQHAAASAPVNVPGISAGPYPDPEDRDNRAWAAAELYKTTGEAAFQTSFLNLYSQIPHEFHATMSWQQHTVKAAWAYATTKFPTQTAISDEFKNRLLNEILPNYYQRTMKTHAYHGAYHPFKGYIGYGTFGMAQSYAFDYIMFSKLLNKPELLDLAKIQLDIPLGNNPLSQSYITGIGSRSPLFPLHWSTIGSKFSRPVPGVPVFGPAASLSMNRPSSFAIQDSTNRYPFGFKKEDPYPVLRRYTDAREAVEMSEFTVQEMAVTAAAFAFFSNVDDVALPVKLVSFTAATENCQVKLEWATTEELGADFFEIQKSRDGKDFFNIGRVEASGAGSRYFVSDTIPFRKNYYRLKQVDLDGTFTYSRIISAQNLCATETFKLARISRTSFELIPDRNALNANADLTATIYSLEGKVRQKFPVNAQNAMPVDCEMLQSGLYILKIHSGQDENVFTAKLFIY